MFSLVNMCSLEVTLDGIFRVPPFGCGNFSGGQVWRLRCVTSLQRSKRFRFWSIWSSVFLNLKYSICVIR